MSVLRPHILIADSEEEVREALSRQAHALGLSSVTAGNVGEALHMARTLLPDVVVVDVSSRLEGRDLLAALARDEATSGIQVVVLSEWEDQFVRHACLKLGACDYSVKPFDHIFMRRLARKTGLSPGPEFTH